MAIDRQQAQSSLVSGERVVRQARPKENMFARLFNPFLADVGHTINPSHDHAHKKEKERDLWTGVNGGSASTHYSRSGSSFSFLSREKEEISDP